jgi:hypothetical protein
VDNWTYCTKIKREEEERRRLTYCTKMRRELREEEEKRRLTFCTKKRREEGLVAKVG